MSNTINILSWNYQGKTNKYKLGALRQLATENKADIIVLQEASGIKISSILNTTHSEISYLKPNGSAGVRVFLKHNMFSHTPAKLGYFNKYALVKLKFLNSTETFNLIAVHLYSKVGRSERKQMWENLPFIEEINNWEKSSGTDKSIMIGDFNHNPFDSNMLDPNVINSRDSRQIINHQKKFSSIGTKESFWYNPMWNFLGDHDRYSNSDRIPGTYFFNKEDENPIWNLLDGFMVRPSLMNNIDFSSSRIITGTSSHKFIKSTLMKRDESFIHEYYSDHLPIILTINIK
jgi:exonuclease III